jgi:hypothetical protein
MNARLLAAFLCLASLSTGCIIVDHDGPDPYPSGQPGNVTLAWTFGADGRCVNVPEVKSIKVTIPGEQLDSNGYYACNTAGTDGITLHNFRAGNYSITIEALDASGLVIYKATDTFTVNGNVLVRMDLTPNGKPFAYLSWSFPALGSNPNPNCSQTYVNKVSISVDNGAWVDLTCEEGMTTMGTKSAPMEPGTHTIRMVAYGRDQYNRDGLPLYTTQGTMTLPRSGSIFVSYKFFEVGGMSLKWKLWDGFAGKFKDCTEAGLSGVRINLIDMSNNTPIFGDAGEAYACTAAPVVYQYLKPGRYKVFIRGMAGSTMSYTNENDAPTYVNVNAFDQRTPTDPAETITISKQ